MEKYVKALHNGLLPGHKPSTIYRVHADRELYHSHYQCVHTKIPAGIPPSYPGPDPQSENARLQTAWKQKMDEFSLYYLALFRPEETCFDGTLSGYSYDYPTLLDWMKSLDLSTKLIDYLGLQALNNHMFATVSTSACRQLFCIKM